MFRSNQNGTSGTKLTEIIPSKKLGSQLEEDINPLDRPGSIRSQNQRCSSSGSQSRRGKGKTGKNGKNKTDEQKKPTPTTPELEGGNYTGNNDTNIGRRFTISSIRSWLTLTSDGNRDYHPGDDVSTGSVRTPSPVVVKPFNDNYGKSYLFVVTPFMILTLMPFGLYFVKFFSPPTLLCCELWEEKHFLNKSRVTCDFGKSMEIVTDQNCFYWPATFFLVSLLAVSHECYLRWWIKAGSTRIFFGANPPKNVGKVWKSSLYMFFYAIIPFAMILNSFGGDCFNIDTCQNGVYLVLRIFFIAFSLLLPLLTSIILPIVSLNCKCDIPCKMYLFVRWNDDFTGEEKQIKVINKYKKYYAYVREFVILFFFFTVPGNLINQLHEDFNSRHHRIAHHLSRVCNEKA